MRVLMLMAAFASLTACAGTPRQPVPPTPPPEVRLEPGSAAPSLVEQLTEARKLAEAERERAETFEERVDSLESEAEALRNRMTIADRRLEELETETRRGARRERELTDALLTCEIEKARLERRLLEVRLADLQPEDTGGQ